MHLYLELKMCTKLLPSEHQLSSANAAPNVYVQAQGLPFGDSSLLHVPHPMAIAGERFRESYYWDSLWMFKGLVASKMWTSASELLANLLSLVDTHGFVPNGCRVSECPAMQPISNCHNIRTCCAVRE
jgi:neutral trehalase